ncbi:hypothetical protein GEMRC1_001786 [Eukaryota sp. GEM-RC1]
MDMTPFSPSRQHLQSLLRLIENDQLYSLYLRFFDLSSSFLHSLSHLLPSVQNLVAIDLWSCGIGSSGLSTIFSCLPPFIESIDLGDNCIDDSGLLTLLVALTSSNSTPPLHTLLLAQNNLTDTGAATVADIIKSVPTLRRLDLRDNNVHDIGAFHLANALETSNLVYLSLFHNPISDTGAKYLLDSLRRNNSLKTLDLRLTQVNSSILIQIFQATLEIPRKALDESSFLHEPFSGKNTCQNTFDHVDCNQTQRPVSKRKFTVFKTFSPLKGSGFQFVDFETSNRRHFVRKSPSNLELHSHVNRFSILQTETDDVFLGRDYNPCDDVDHDQDLSDLSPKEDQIPEKDSLFAKREELISEKESDISSREAQLSEKESLFAQREELISQMESDLSSREVQFSAKETDISSREDQLSEKESLLLNLKN